MEQSDYAALNPPLRTHVQRLPDALLAPPSVQIRELHPPRPRADLLCPPHAPLDRAAPGSCRRDVPTPPTNDPPTIRHPPTSHPPKTLHRADLPNLAAAWFPRTPCLSERRDPPRVVTAAACPHGARPPHLPPPRIGPDDAGTGPPAGPLPEPASPRRSPTAAVQATAGFSPPIEPGSRNRRVPRTDRVAPWLCDPPSTTSRMPPGLPWHPVTNQ
jgi:hypothetical protein